VKEVLRDNRWFYAMVLRLIFRIAPHISFTAQLFPSVCSLITNLVYSTVIVVDLYCCYTSDVVVFLIWNRFLGS